MKPLGDHVLIEPIPEERERSTTSGIILMPDKQSRVEKGKVIAVGPGTVKVEMQVCPGNIVLFNKFSGTFVEEDGKKYQLVRQGDILGIDTEGTHQCEKCGAYVPADRQLCHFCESRVAVTGETSDGYHTFNELYHHRAVLFSVICHCFKDIAWKSLKHHDGSMYDGMFIVGVDTPWGQATYHYDINPYWDMFAVSELESAPMWDGHLPVDAIERIGKLVNIFENAKV